MTTLSKIRKPALIAIGIFLLIFLLVILIVIPKRKSQPQNQLPKPSIAPNVIAPKTKEPEQLPQDVKTIREKIIASAIANNSGDLLLYKTANFKIEYISSPKYFFVTITSEPVQKARDDSQKWFKKFGLEQTDLCDLPVRFVLSSRELRLNNPKFTSLPDTCKP